MTVDEAVRTRVRPLRPAIASIALRRRLATTFEAELDAALIFDATDRGDGTSVVVELLLSIETRNSIENCLLGCGLVFVERRGYEATCGRTFWMAIGR